MNKFTLLLISGLFVGCASAPQRDVTKWLEAIAYIQVHSKQCAEVNFIDRDVLVSTLVAIEEAKQIVEADYTIFDTRVAQYEAANFELHDEICLRTEVIAQKFIGEVNQLKNQKPATYVYPAREIQRIKTTYCNTVGSSTTCMQL